MKKKSTEKAPAKFDLIWTRGKEKKKEALEASVSQLDQLCAGMGLLDPMDAEPAVIFLPEEGKT